MKEMTQAEQKTYDCILEFFELNNFSPTIKDLACMLGVSRYRVCVILARIREKGYIDYDDCSSTGRTITVKGYKYVKVGD